MKLPVEELLQTAALQLMASTRKVEAVSCFSIYKDQGKPSPPVKFEKEADMEFSSILFDQIEDTIDLETTPMPDCFTDLNLDQIVAGIVKSYEHYRLEPFLYKPLSSIGSVRYRHEIMQDLENEQNYQIFFDFSQAMKHHRALMADWEKMFDPYQAQGCFLNAAEHYCKTMVEFSDYLQACNLRSQGFRSLQSYVSESVQSELFRSFYAEINQLKSDLNQICYTIRVRGTTIRIQYYENEIDYSEVITRSFDKFKETSGKTYSWQIRDSFQMNRVESGIIAMVAKLYPELFQKLADFCDARKAYIPAAIERFDREIQFYLAYLDYLTPLKQAGLHFSYPEMDLDATIVRVRDGFDLALARQLQQDGILVVANDLELDEPERIVIVSGPNQGGKTTFARTIGQLFYLASLGLPIPGTQASLFLLDNLFTHFEKVEDSQIQRGKLHDDLVRIHDVLDQATRRSVLIINEIFSATTLKDAVFLGRKIISRISSLQALCICVTFIDELSTCDERTISMVSTVDPDNSDRRTYKVVRQTANGLSYALSIARKHGLTYEQLREWVNR